MKKASINLLSKIFISKNYTNSKTLISKTPNLIIPNKINQNPFFQNFNTLSDQIPTPQIPSRQKKSIEKTRLDESFENATSTREMLDIFKQMEPSFSSKELGLAALKIGLKLDQQGEDHEKTLAFALKALDSMNFNDDKVNLPLAMTLQLLGSVCYSLKRFNDSLGYLIKANRLLGKIEEAGFCNVDDIRPIVHAVEFGLANTKTALGRREEALCNLRKCLELKELMLGEESKELGDANRDLAEAYVALLDFKGALPFCTKALEIHRGKLGQNSVEVAHDRRVLGVIYTGLEEHEKALVQNQLSQKVLKNWGMSSDLLRAEIDAANIQIALGRFDEAVDTLKSIVQQTDKDSYDRALVFVSMGKAMCDQEKFSDAKKCMELACAVLDKKEVSSPLEVSEAYMEISMVYETMNEFEKAIILLKKAQFMFEKLPQEQHSEGSVCARIGWLLLLTGKVKDAIPYLEGAAEKMKECFGAKHYGVGYIYNNLGAAYLELDRPQSAAQMFAVSKDIMAVSLGPAHVDTIEACQNLSKAYGEMGSYPLAIKFQEQVIEAWEGHGSSAEGEVREANRILKQLKNKAREMSLNEPTVTALPLPLKNEFASRKSTQPDNPFSEKQ